MNPLDKELLVLLSRMPFLDRLEAAAISGWSSGALYESVARMQEAGLVRFCSPRHRPHRRDPQVLPHRIRAPSPGRSGGSRR